MTLLSFFLALGAVAFSAAGLVALASLLLTPLIRRLTPVARAEVSAWLTLAPGLTALALATAVSVPSALYGLGLGADHCLGHAHHPHLCAWHGAVLPPWLALAGACAWAAALLRGAQALKGLVHAEHLGRSLTRLGEPRDGYHLVPATVPVCHAVGLVRPRVLVSQAVVDRLDARGLDAALAHERAHLDRSDTRWSALLALAACAAPFASRWTSLWREAAEEAADDIAAAHTDGVTVARALVAVARLQLGRTPGFAFGATGLERRVNRLLGERAPPRTARTLRGALGMAAVAAALVLTTHEPLHHIIEELWEHLLIG